MTVGVERAKVALASGIQQAHQARSSNCSTRNRLRGIELHTIWRDLGCEAAILVNARQAGIDHTLGGPG